MYAAGGFKHVKLQCPLDDGGRSTAELTYTQACMTDGPDCSECAPVGCDTVVVQEDTDVMINMLLPSSGQKCVE